MKEINEVLEDHSMRRREFISKSAKLAYTVPAIALLFSGNPVQAQAVVSGNDFPTCDPTVSLACIAK